MNITKAADNALSLARLQREDAIRELAEMAGVVAQRHENTAYVGFALDPADGPVQTLTFNALYDEDGRCLEVLDPDWFDGPVPSLLVTGSDLELIRSWLMDSQSIANELDVQECWEYAHVELLVVAAGLVADEAAALPHTAAYATCHVEQADDQQVLVLDELYTAEGHTICSLVGTPGSEVSGTPERIAGVIESLRHVEGDNTRLSVQKAHNLIVLPHEAHHT